MSELSRELRTELSKRFPGAREETLVADASTRRFHRLFLRDGTTRVIMDYGKAFDGETDDVRLARIFGQAGLPVARVFEVLPEAGALVLEDLGDLTLENALRSAASGGPRRSDDLYRSAVRLAVDIATRGTDVLRRSDRAIGPALDTERFLFEMRFFLEHYVGGFLGRAPSPGLRNAVESLAETAASHPRVLCHRDYHSRNIMVRSDGSLAMVDIQDARWGPDTYDVASLLCDAYVDLGDPALDLLFDDYVGLLPGPSDTASFRERFEIVAAQRMIKALGTFGYQLTVMGRERYRSAVPRTIARLSRRLPKSGNTRQLADTLSKEGILSS